MGFFKRIFLGKTIEEFEHEGDQFMQRRLWGDAKIAYEGALDKLSRSSDAGRDLRESLEQKLRQSKEALAREHILNADDIAGSDLFQDACDLYLLAMDLTEDSELRQHLKQKISELEHLSKPSDETEISFYGRNREVIDGQGLEAHEEEYFEALTATLPEDIQERYLSYGDNFAKGYMALNHGDFETAVTCLEAAMKDNPSSESFIPLELASAYMNIERPDDARGLLETFIENHPDVLPAYQLLCEILWEKDDIEGACDLLSSVPEPLTESVAYAVMKGETLFSAEQYSEAEDYYSGILSDFGYNELIARALAKTLEARGEKQKAMSLYRKMMDQCTSCHTRIDPFIKQQYANLCFDSGIHTSQVLEIYLSLAQDFPENSSFFYHRVSSIYRTLGNKKEAERFREIAEKE